MKKIICAGVGDNDGFFEMDAKGVVTDNSALLSATDAADYLIKKGGYWYRPNSCGYTDSAEHAGLFTKEEATKAARECDELTIYHANAVFDLSKIQEKIDRLEAIKKVIGR